MADFSSKKISEVHTSIVHGDNGSGAVAGMSNATTNVQLRTGNNGTTPLQMTTDKVSINQSSMEATGWRANSDQELDVRATNGTGGRIFAGTVTVWQNSGGAGGVHGDFNNSGAEGGQINFKDGASNPASDPADDSYFIDNYMDPGGQHQLRTVRVASGGDGSGTNVSTQIMTQREVNSVPYVTIGQIAPKETLTVNGNIALAGGTVLGPKSQTIYVNSKTSGTYPGDDNNPGTKAQPVKTLSKAISMACPYSHVSILCYGGYDAGSTRTYNICGLTLYNLNITINLCHSDEDTGTVAGYADGYTYGTPVSNNTTATIQDNYRTYTKFVQSITNELNPEGADTTDASWDLWGSSVWLMGGTLECSFPGSGIAIHKSPFRVVGRNSAINLGRWTNGSLALEVKFTAYNSNPAGDSIPHTCVAIAEYGHLDLKTKYVKWHDVAGASTAHSVVNYSGTASYSILQSDHQIPAGGTINNDYNQQVYGYNTGTTY